MSTDDINKQDDPGIAIPGEATGGKSLSPDAETKVAATSHNAYEEDALSQGWTPEADWVKQGKDPAEWRSAREFVERGKLLDQLTKYKRELQNSSGILKQLKEHHENVKEVVYKKAVEDIKAGIKAALKNEDFVAAEELRERLADVKEAKVEADKKDPVSNVQIAENPANAEFDAWHVDNSWYDLAQKDETSRVAFMIGETYKNENPSATLGEVLKHVTRRVKTIYPDKFGGSKSGGSESKTPAVISGNSRSGRGQTNHGLSITEADLTDDQRKAMRDFIKEGVFATKEEYLKEVQLISEGR